MLSKMSSALYIEKSPTEFSVGEDIYFAERSTLLLKIV